MCAFLEAIFMVLKIIAPRKEGNEDNSGIDFLFSVQILFMRKIFFTPKNSTYSDLKLGFSGRHNTLPQYHVFQAKY